MNPRILLPWIVVAIPLSWGVAQSINSALPLFGGKSSYIPWVLGVPPAPSPAAKPSAASPAPSATPTPAAASPSPAAAPAPAPEASPFSTAQPSATVPPVVAPTPPTT